MRGLIVMIAVFATTYWLVALPLLQRLSQLWRGRRFVVRLRDWSPKNPEHRWDVTFSVVAFLISLAAALLALDVSVKAGIVPDPMQR